jgi:hypothetical protein
MRNLSLILIQEERDFSARAAPRFTENVLRERNDNRSTFFAAYFAELPDCAVGCAE